MSVNSIWRALPPSCRRQIGPSIRTGYNWRALPCHDLSATSIIATRPTGRNTSTTTNGINPNCRSPKAEEELAPKWSGSGVVGIALGAALLGWGMATVTTNRSPLLLDSKRPVPRYASLKEMEVVRPPNESPDFVVFWCQFDH